VAFTLRYDAGSLAHDLAGERSWAEKFHDELLARSEELNPFGKDRVGAMVRHALGEPLSRLKEAEEEQAEAQAIEPPPK